LAYFVTRTRSLGGSYSRGLGRIVADQLTRAVGGAVLDVLGHIRFNLVPLQILGQRFVPRLAPAAHVALDRNARFLRRLGHTFSGVGRVVIIPQIEFQLVGIIDIAFTPPGEDTLHV